TTFPNPDINNAEIILEGGDKYIESIDASKNYLIITELKNGVETFISKKNFNNGKIESVTMPVSGSISVNPYNQNTDECIVFNSNWKTPSNIYSLNLENNSFENGPFYVGYNIEGLDNLVVEEVEVPSHDGALVPLTIIYNKTNFKKDGSSICYLDGYGAYGISINPYYSISKQPLLDRGVVCAIAHIRGGSEKGNDWYLGGKKTTKPNTWKDFIACGDYLVKNGYTSNDRLAGTGGSAGGIMIGRAMTERPDLFKVAIPQVGCLNTLRAEFSPNGPVNIPEFGTVTIEEEFLALKEMDAYEHIVKGVKYPATLVTSGFNDPRVISWIPAKFAAKLQNNTGSDNPVLLHVDYNTGHFGGETMSEKFKNLSKIYSFMLWQCGNPEFQPKAN
ncbi:MAG: prolyl oligopeptidase family serine peptidase, partial [Ignavibacteria bacterium]|nr:prolyl oligopeptidase family serine peptidase [Ignavibacteria bacterium]